MAASKKRNRTPAKPPESYRDRSYRSLAGNGEFVSSIVKVRETDLHILAAKDVSARAKELVLQYRLQLENYIGAHPAFSSALEPLGADELAPPIVKDMMCAARAAGVGPMAAVAGTMAAYVGSALVTEGLTSEIVVENGGDIYLHRLENCTAAIFAGESPLSYTVGVKIAREMMPCGVCTSSGTVGHSLSFGDADSVTVLAKSTPLADAAATRLGNEVGRKGGREGLERALQAAQEIPGVAGVVIICGELMGAIGDIELTRI